MITKHRQRPSAREPRPTPFVHRERVCAPVGATLAITQQTSVCSAGAPNPCRTRYFINNTSTVKDDHSHDLKEENCGSASRSSP
jgi:hypothetical protein